ncbi:MAG: GAF domain-containing protein [Janthinobacterium lividum]
MRAQPNEEAIGVLCTSWLAEFLQIERCYLARLYPERDSVYVGPEYRRADLHPASGEYRLSDFPEVVRQVQTQTGVFSDVAGDPDLTEEDKAALGAMDIGAFITSALRQSNEKVIWSLIVASTSSRVWTKGEVAFMEEMAERTWTAVERARAEEALHLIENRNHIQKEAFQSAINGEPLATSLNTLTLIVKQQLGSDMRTALFILPIRMEPACTQSMVQVICPKHTQS